MTACTQKTKSNLATFNILSNGKEIDRICKIVSIRVEKAINKIAFATLEIQDGSAASESFEESESEKFKPGKKIEIKAGYHSDNKTIFKGIITKQNIRLNPQGKSTLRVECEDESIKMTIIKKNEYYFNMTDSEAINKIIGQYGLRKKVTSTTEKLEKLTQYGSTDWDFIAMRAEVNNMVVITDDGEVIVEEPKVDSKPILDLNFGSTIYSINLDMDAKTQLPKVNSYSWSVGNQKIIEATSKEPKMRKLGDLDGKKLAAIFGETPYDIHSTVSIPQERLKKWAESYLLRSRLAKIQGTLSFRGDERPKPGSMIKLDGLGKRFNGDGFMSKVEHEIKNGRWITTVTIGLGLKWFGNKEDVSETPASGLVPSISGLQNGIVTQIDKDPNKEFRIKVDVPIFKEKQKGLWARLSTLYTTTNKGGTFFYPEIGDEVVVGFLNEDPRSPVVLGGLYSKKKPPPFTPDKKNSKKAIVTKSNLKILFDEDKKDIEIVTPKGNSLLLSEGTRKVVLKDQNKNAIEMSAGGIKINSNSNITIAAKGKVNITGANISASAKTSLSLTGLSATVKAKLKATLQGLTTEVKASTMAVIKGALVKIN